MIALLRQNRDGAMLQAVKSLLGNKIDLIP